MLIKAQDLKDIQENKVTLVKNFVSLERNYDFNLISKLMEENHLTIVPMFPVGNLRDVFQMGNITNILKEFKILFDFLAKLFKYQLTKNDGIDLFFSFVSQIGNAHEDIEDVYIIGLHGKTIYRVFDEDNKDYEINKGDLIFIPKGKKHKAIAINSRIIASIGFHGKR
tara:strand:- start:3278 stop:3781 length:504 start_codon:yes stop_codon:yes gene_type:complete